MKVLSTREFRNSQKKYFEMAENERVAIKRGNKFVNLVLSDNPAAVYVDEKWLQEFFSIPEKYRCNPFDYIPTGDLFYADKRNINKLDKAVKETRQENNIRMEEGESLSDFLARTED